LLPSKKQNKAKIVELAGKATRESITNLPVLGESTFCVTNRILRWRRHYRLSK